MEQIKIEQLDKFVSKKVQVSIQDEEGQERAPFSEKTIEKIELCPDRTHVRFYFDKFYFLAVPLNAAVNLTEDEWVAYDEEAGLKYIIKGELFI